MTIIRWEYCTPVNITIILLPLYAWQIPHSAFRESKRWAMNEEYEIIPYSTIWVCVNTCRKNQDVCKHLSFYYSIVNTLTEYQPVRIIRDNKSWKINPVFFCDYFAFGHRIAYYCFCNCIEKSVCDKSAGIFALSVIPLLMFFWTSQLHFTLIPVWNGPDHCYVQRKL